MFTFDLIYYQKYKNIIFLIGLFYIIYIFIKYKKYTNIKKLFIYYYLFDIIEYI